LTLDLFKAYRDHLTNNRRKFSFIEASSFLRFLIELLLYLCTNIKEKMVYESLCLVVLRFESEVDPKNWTGV
jgi:hypothetical protein